MGPKSEIAFGVYFLHRGLPFTYVAACGVGCLLKSLGIGLKIVFGVNFLHRGLPFACAANHFCRCGVRVSIRQLGGERSFLAFIFYIGGCHLHSGLATKNEKETPDVSNKRQN